MFAPRAAFPRSAAAHPGETVVSPEPRETPARADQDGARVVPVNRPDRSTHPAAAARRPCRVLRTDAVLAGAPSVRRQLAVLS